MKNSIREELTHHILDRIADGVIDDSNADDWHYHCFNEDYYIIGYHEASKWLKLHEVDAFEAVSICQQWEENVLGEKQKVYDNSETVVNMLAYIYGEELLSEIAANSIEELKQILNENN